MPRGSTTSPPAGSSGIGFGVITLQRPVDERDVFVDLDEALGPVAAPMGPAILRGLQARTWLAEHTDDELLAVPWRCADDVTQEHHGRPGADDPSVILLRQGGGLRRVVRLDTVGAALVSVCDGTLAAGAALTAIAALLEAEADEVRAQALPLLRDLVADGLARLDRGLPRPLAWHRGWTPGEPAGSRRREYCPESGRSRAFAQVENAICE